MHAMPCPNATNAISPANWCLYTGMVVGSKAEEELLSMTREEVEKEHDMTAGRE